MTVFELTGLYEQARDTPSDIYLHVERMADLVVERNAQHVIELGTRTGVSTIAWLHGLHQTGGRLTSVDLDAKPPIGEWSHWTYVQGDDLDTAVIGFLEPADIVFIDTSHHYLHTVRELHTYRWLVKPGGIIVCHDTELARPEGETDPRPFPVRRAIEQFTAETGMAWHNFPECNGLGIIDVGG